MGVLMALHSVSSGGSGDSFQPSAYGIGQLQPEMVTAITEQNKDLSDWVLSNFPDLSPRYIIDRLGLLDPFSWSYIDSAAYGHFGRELFPWEKIY